MHTSVFYGFLPLKVLHSKRLNTIQNVTMRRRTVRCSCNLWIRYNYAEIDPFSYSFGHIILTLQRHTLHDTGFWVLIERRQRSAEAIENVW